MKTFLYLLFSLFILLALQLYWRSEARQISRRFGREWGAQHRAKALLGTVLVAGGLYWVGTWFALW